jgi:hypothetical protein
MKLDTKTRWLLKDIQNQFHINRFLKIMFHE